MSAIEQLDGWNRKGYRFEISSGGNYQPGDGVSVKLTAAGRSVFADDIELHRDGGDDGPDYWPTINDVIAEALRKWHADKSPKRYRILLSAGTAPPTTLNCRRFLPNDNRWHVELVAESEAAAMVSVHAVWPGTQFMSVKELGPAEPEKSS